VEEQVCMFNKLHSFGNISNIFRRQMRYLTSGDTHFKGHMERQDVAFQRTYGMSGRCISCPFVKFCVRFALLRKSQMYYQLVM